MSLIHTDKLGSSIKESQNSNSCRILVAYVYPSLSLLNFVPQILPLLPPAWGLPGPVSRAGHPLLAPFQYPGFPLQSLPHPPPSSLKQGTPVMGTLTTGQSTWPSVTWGSAVGVILEAPPTAATSVRPRTPPCKGVPLLFPHLDAPPTQRARRAPAGGPVDTRAPFLTRVSIRNSGMVSKQEASSPAMAFRVEMISASVLLKLQNYVFDSYKSVC